MTRYRLRVKSSPNWRNYRRACLSISVGQPVHEGAKLTAALDWINRNFETCIIGVSDTLQRWNLLSAPDMTMEEAYTATLQAGDAWLERNRSAIGELKIPVQIIRWDHWLQHPDFAATHEAFQNLYINNNVLRTALDQDTEEFLVRHHATNEADEQRLISTSRSFILEEIAVYTLLHRELPSAKIYPSQSLEALRVVREGYVPEAPKGLEAEYHTRITFDRIDDPGSSLFATNQAA